MSKDETAGKLGFLDSLSSFFSKGDGDPPASAIREAPKKSETGRLHADFEAALRGLEERISERSAVADEVGTATSGHRVASGETPEQRKRRMEETHRAIRADIVAMHARLASGIGSADLDQIASFLLELDSFVRAGRDSHQLLPRARYAISRKLQSETGSLAVARLLALLERAGVSWPDPTQTNPGASSDEIERSRRRRRAESREAFMAAGLKRTAERMLGIVSAWGAEYPERGSTLWDESVLEGVAAGIRGQLVKQSVEVLREDVEGINQRTEAAIGAEVAALRSAVESGVTSLDKANQAVASALAVLDGVVPEVAWEHIQAKLPSARGQWPS